MKISALKVYGINLLLSRYRGQAATDSLLFRSSYTAYKSCLLRNNCTNWGEPYTIVGVTMVGCMVMFLQPRLDGHISKSDKIWRTQTM